MDRYVISVCGPNGAGKSTFTKSVLSNLNLPIVDPDLYSTQGISEIAAGKLSIQLINAYLSQSVSFIKESTLTSKFDIAKFQQAKELGYENILIYLYLPSVKESLQRVERRMNAGGHQIPKETILRRFDKSFKNLELVKDTVDYCFIINATLAYPLQQEFQKMNKFMTNLGHSA